jgi:hypothetical protein
MGWSAWRHSVVFGAAGIVAVLATFWFAMLRPPMFSSKVLVYVPAAGSIDTQALIATAAAAEGAANAVARCYVRTVWLLPRSPEGRLRALVVAPATPATSTTMSAWVAETAGFGTLVGLVLGVIAAFALVLPRRAS